MVVEQVVLVEVVMVVVMLVMLLATADPNARGPAGEGGGGGSGGGRGGRVGRGGGVGRLGRIGLRGLTGGGNGLGVISCGGAPHSVFVGCCSVESEGKEEEGWKGRERGKKRMVVIITPSPAADDAGSQCGRCMCLAEELSHRLPSQRNFHYITSIIEPVSV